VRVLLISTAHPFDENPLPPLSLAYLAGALERDGFEVQILDFLVNSYHPGKVRKKIEEFHPQLVGVTCVTMNYPLATQMLQVCKESDPAVVTVIGGPHVSFTLEDTLLKSPWIDVVVIGEGDDTIVELARAVDGGSSIYGIPGTACVENGNLVTTASRLLIEDIDRLDMPARHLIPPARYLALGTPCTIITSRGCPYGCRFCSASRMFGRRVRFRTPGLVVDEIESIRKDYGFQNINIVDDTFTVNHNHVREICEEMLRRNLDITWNAYARVDTIDEELAMLIKRAGCHMVLFGIESADEGILKTIGKGITPRDMRRGVKTATDAGLEVFSSFIIGLPGENADTILTSRAFASEINEDYGVQYGYHMLAPLPGTDLYEKAGDYGIRILTDDWAQFDANRPIVEMPGMTPQMAQDAMAFYDDVIDKAWWEVRRRADAGDTYCIARLEGKESSEFIWSLIQKDVIEDLYSLDAVNDPGKAEGDLVRNIAQVLGQPFDLVRRQARKLVEKGFLRLTPQGDCVRWDWGKGLE